VSDRLVRARRAVANFSSLHLIQHLWQNSTKTADFFASHHWKIGTYAEIPPGNIHVFMLPSSAMNRQPGFFRFFLAPTVGVFREGFVVS